MGAPENPPAFPGAPCDANSYAGHAGMTLRDWFAGQALLSSLSASASHDGCYNYETAAHAAYEIADAMIAERLPDPVEPIAIVERRDPPAPDACRYCDSGLPEQECSCVPF